MELIFGTDYFIAIVTLIVLVVWQTGYVLVTLVTLVITSVIIVLVTLLSPQSISILMKFQKT